MMAIDGDKSEVMSLDIAGKGTPFSPQTTRRPSSLAEHILGARLLRVEEAMACSAVADSRPPDGAD